MHANPNPRVVSDEGRRRTEILWLVDAAAKAVCHVPVPVGLVESGLE